MARESEEGVKKRAWKDDGCGWQTPLILTFGRQGQRQAQPGLQSEF